MKKFNLFVMSLLATASFTLNSCSTDDTMSSTSQQQSVDGFYMTLQVKGSANGTGTRTEQQTSKEDGTTVESTIDSGTIYIYDGTKCVFTKTITKDNWKTAPTQTTEGVTKPIKVSVNDVTEGTKYQVYFLANNTSITDPLAANKAFTASTTGGANYAENNAFVMFNQNDKSRKAAHSEVEFAEKNKSEDDPATAGTIYLDRVVSRIDAPTVSAQTISSEVPEGTDQTKHIDYIKSVAYQTYAVSNLNNNSYVVQNWDTDYKTLSAYVTGEKPYYLPYEDFGDKYQALGLDNFKSNTDLAKSYCFENTTNDVEKATAMYFCIKATLTEAAKTGADFTDGTFYRYDNRVYTSLKAIVEDPDVSNPFQGAGLTAEEALKLIKGDDDKLIPEDKTGTDDEGETYLILPEFRQQFNIEVYREGNMYYRYALNDNNYYPEGYYSVLRNSIYRLTVNAIYDLGKDVPNGDDKNEKKPNYFMNVTVDINPWVLNAKTIQLK